MLDEVFHQGFWHGERRGNQPVEKPKTPNERILEGVLEDMNDWRERLDRKRAIQGLPPLTDDEFMLEWDRQGNASGTDSRGTDLQSVLQDAESRTDYKSVPRDSVPREFESGTDLQSVSQQSFPPRAFVLLVLGFLFLWATRDRSFIASRNPEVRMVQALGDADAGYETVPRTAELLFRPGPRTHGVGHWIKPVESGTLELCARLNGFCAIGLIEPRRVVRGNDPQTEFVLIRRLQNPRLPSQNLPPTITMSRKTDRFVPNLELLDERCQPSVLYYGGNVLPNVEAQAVYLGSQWATPTASMPTPSKMDASLANLTNSAYMDTLTQAGYGVGRGSASAGAIDKTAFPSNATVSDATIQSRIQADIKSGLLQQPDANRLYVVYVQPNVAVNLGFGQGTTQQGVLGYHGAFGGTDASGHATTIRYAVIAYPGGSVGNSSMGTSAVDQLTAVASHEVAEAATDPDVNYAQLGWYDPRRGEIGDITENNPNALVRLNGYLVQLCADKNDQLLSLPSTSTPTPTPSPTPGTPSTPSTQQAGTTTRLVAGPVVYHGWFFPPTVTLTAIVSSSAGAIPAGGTVQLLYNGSVIANGKVQVINGIAYAQFTIAFYSYGQFHFTTHYAGSDVSAPSTSNGLTVRI